MKSDIQKQANIWISASRPRTLILAVASIILGTLLAASAGGIDARVTFLTMLTALLLQILSNMSNDYGDSIHGADHHERKGPPRVVQSGMVSLEVMKRTLLIIVALTIVSGALLILLSLGPEGLLWLLLFGTLGLLAIGAAITYTAGQRPYGYIGLGDLAVLTFFGWIGVLGSYYLQAKDFELRLLLPATALGLMAVAVLNINNIRDLESDKAAGKFTIPVRLGLKAARRYHYFLLLTSPVLSIIYVLLEFTSLFQLLFLLLVPLLVQNARDVARLSAEQLNPLLGKMSLITLLYAVLFGVGQSAA